MNCLYIIYQPRGGRCLVRRCVSVAWLLVRFITVSVKKKGTQYTESISMTEVDIRLGEICFYVVMFCLGKNIHSH